MGRALAIEWEPQFAPKPERIRDIELAKLIDRPIGLLRKASRKGRVPWAAEIGGKDRYTYRLPEIRLWIRQGGPDEVFPKRPAKRGFVYVVAGGEWVKNGFATEVTNRLRGLQTSCPMPLRVIAEIKGTMVTERRLHRRFHAYRAEGEWFRYEGAVADWIKEGCPL